jgi:hypothetical protein
VQQFTLVADKSSALSEVAKGLGRLRYFRLARQAVESSSSSSDKLAAYIVVMREYAIEKNPGLARMAQTAKRTRVSIYTFYWVRHRAVYVSWLSDSRTVSFPIAATAASYLHSPETVIITVQVTGLLVTI